MHTGRGARYVLGIMRRIHNASRTYVAGMHTYELGGHARLE